MNQDFNTLLIAVKTAIDAYLLTTVQAPLVQVRTRRKNVNYEFTAADLPLIEQHLVRFSNNAVNVKATVNAVLGRKATKTEMYRLQQLLRASGKHPLRGELKRKHSI